MGYSITSSNDNCYPNTNVLINKLGIKNQKQLDENEILITSIKSLEIELNSKIQEPNFEYYCNLHYLLFNEIYDWAGKLRTINVSKLKTVFCPHEQIESMAISIFKRLKEMDYFKKCNKSELICEFADLYNSLNYLHPFREGNGRVERLYFIQLARWINRKLDFSKIDSDRMMIATIHASAGTMDYLESIFAEALE